MRDTSNRSLAVTATTARRPRHRHRDARQQAEPSSPIQTQGTALPSGPRTLQTGLVGANHVKAPPPPLYTFEHPIEFKQLAPESRIAGNRNPASGGLTWAFFCQPRHVFVMKVRPAREGDRPALAGARLLR